VDVGHDSVCFLEVNDLGTPTVLRGPPRAHQGRTLTGPGESPERRSGGRRCRRMPAWTARWAQRRGPPP